MPPRQPTKNRINMHDIVAQPLSALPDAVDAILRRPEALDDQEIGSIFRECSYIFLRAEEALSVRNGDAFCALLKLLSEGFAHSEASFEEGVKTFALHSPLLQTVRVLFRVVVEHGALPLHAAGTVELVQVVSSLCDGEAIKDMCGSLFMRGLADCLARISADPAEAQRNFHLQRGAATALINLVKGSKENKLRLPSWQFVADCCAASVDVFFQLQCVELLFRVSRQKKSMLAQLGNAFSAETIDQIRSLPNDGTLLSRMTGLVESLNEGREEVLRYRLTQVAAADTMLTESTDAYFTPHYFIVMVTSSNADNITVPYRFIRSVTLGKDGRVIIKLEEFPVKLEVLLNHSAGMNTITLHMTLEQLGRFKQSPIRPWIVSALTARREATKTAAQAMDPSRVVTAGVKRRSEGALSPSREEDGAEPRVSVSVKGLVVGGSNGSLAAPRSPSAAAKEVSTTGAAPPPAPLAAATAATVDATARMRRMIDSIGQRSTVKETQAIYAQLRRLIDARMELHKGEAVVALNKAMGDIQGRVDTTRRTAEEARTAWRSSAGARVGELDGRVAEAQHLVAAAVEKLNTDLRTVRQGNMALTERVACIEVELQRTLGESRELEAKQLHDLRMFFDAELGAQEEALEQHLIHRTNSAVVLSDYVHATATRGAMV